MQTPQLSWDSGTAYDMFISLSVLHDPDKYGLRGAWAAGVRSRLPGAEREVLQNIIPHSMWPLHWIHALPAPKDGAIVISELEKMAPADRIPTLFLDCDSHEAIVDLLKNVAARGSWNEQDKDLLVDLYKEHWHKAKSAKKMKDHAVIELDLWANLTENGEGLLTGLRSYQKVFFAEEELRIRPALKQALVKAQALAEEKELPDLLNDLSQGVKFPDTLKMKELVLAPSFWADPLMLFGKLDTDRDIFIFGGRPSDASLVPGDVVPDALSQTMKALADPTRLRILRYLSVEPLTPAELARRLRLRAPTVVHHLHTLRLARLVHITLEDEGRRYQARRRAIDEACRMLAEYLDKDVVEK
jgi:DNA-binding transcriptional ArsR family regulator